MNMCQRQRGKWCLLENRHTRLGREVSGNVLFPNLGQPGKGSDMHRRFFGWSRGQKQLSKTFDKLARLLSQVGTFALAGSLSYPSE